MAAVTEEQIVVHFKIVVCFADALAFLQQNTPQSTTERRAGEVWEMGRPGSAVEPGLGQGGLLVKMECGNSGGVAELNPLVVPFVLSLCFPLVLVQLGAPSLCFSKSCSS